MRLDGPEVPEIEIAEMSIGVRDWRQLCKDIHHITSTTTVKCNQLLLPSKSFAAS